MPRLNDPVHYRFQGRCCAATWVSVPGEPDELYILPSSVGNEGPVRPANGHSATNDNAWHSRDECPEGA